MSKATFYRINLPLLFAGRVPDGLLVPKRFVPAVDSRLLFLQCPLY
jgi:hypothetical protein